LIIELVGDDYKILGTPEEFGESQAMEKVKAVLTVEPMDVKTIAREADTTEKLTRKVLESLRERGETERTGAGKKNDAFLYCLFSEHNSLLSQYDPIGKETNQNGHGNRKGTSPIVQAAIDAFNVNGFGNNENKSLKERQWTKKN
jgi:hypothetical protein